ncbi:hypothetical protein BN137_2565 [Cronobacter condimenti 1330]|uniref:Uncharacterized protein n=1 Tax=Cronobacter condimenti 1330 TaxID=1073999 RepID=K8A166_9ENTR|nr:hypothetical protein BN137_2565 [Cronobacter condimenti 1330]
MPIVWFYLHHPKAINSRVCLLLFSFEIAGDRLARHYGNITMRLTGFCHADILMNTIMGRYHG